jgi:hypothetical protein
MRGCVCAAGRRRRELREFELRRRCHLFLS